MVTPTPFQRMLQQLGQQANTEPAAAWDQLDTLAGKTTSPTEVMQLAGFAANLGGAVLKRDDATIAFLDTLLDHPMVEEESPARKSILRAKAVIHHCAGNESEAETCKSAGVTNATEQCRLAIMCAQTLVARQQAQKAIPFLKQCAALCQELADDDEIVQQVANIAANVMQLAEVQSRRAKDLLLAASAAVNEALARNAKWETQHMGLYQRAKAQVLAGNPNQALNAVQKMMALENANQAGPFFRFQSAAIACRAQLLRGQVKIASGAFGACKEMAASVEQADQRQQLDKMVADLEQALNDQRDRANQV